jgi:hypothetical protein
MYLYFYLTPLPPSPPPPKNHPSIERGHNKKNPQGPLDTPQIVVTNFVCLFVGLSYQGKDIVFRFAIEYSSLRDFGP